MSFVHLHTHSHYSLLNASCTVPALLDKCREYKMPAMALTDYGNMFGTLEFYFEAEKRGIKAIPACELFYVKDFSQKGKWEERAIKSPSKTHKSLLLLAKNQTGYKNLCQIVTQAWQKGFYFVPRTDYATLEKHKEGLFALSAGGRGLLPQLFQEKGKDKAIEEIQKLKRIFGSSFYLQLLPEGSPNSEKYNLFLASAAESEKCPLIAGGDVHYVEKKDSLVQDILFCIGTNRTLYDKDRERLGPPEFYLKSPEEMRGMFKKHPQISDIFQKACDQTLQLADECSVRFKIKDSRGQPIYHLPRLVQKEESLKSLSEKGLAIRFKEAELRGEKISEEKKSEYAKRIHYELEIIERTGFTGYFHIVHDFIRWAKKNQVPVGPGRGSGASSLVSYCLGITNLDPMPLNLIFERFLNPDRISMPDFDIDFCQEGRPRVIDYITKKYGSDCSAHVVTYGKLNVRAAIRDVGRVLNLSYGDVDFVAKLIPNILGITLKEALKKEPRLKEKAEEDPKIGELIQLTALLEGLVRHVSIHAAGIIIADNPIINYAPLFRGVAGENVIQYDLKHAEKIGLVKFDFLGLKTLTLIEEAFRLIEKHKGKKLRPENISLKDNGIYEIMSRGDTAGIFQFEGAGITNLLVKSQPTCFEDIVAVNALYRPGPMNMIPSYLDRKKARAPVEYIFPELEPILKETYGIIIYQEQVQQIAVEIAGYSYGEADVLRRAMGKKIQSVMAKQKNRFLEGAERKNFHLKKAEKLFDQMAEFAKYGFNKSHAAAYCVLAAQTAWLKRYYPLEFLTAQMTIEQNDSDKLAAYVQDTKVHGFVVLQPHVNRSFQHFAIQGDKIIFSLGAVKGIGVSAAKEIARVRESLEDKKFNRLEDFFSSSDLKRVNKKTLEALVKSGALDELGFNRREIFENIDKFCAFGAKQAEDRASGQSSLFESLENEGPMENQLKLKSLPDWPLKKRLGFEKEFFGFYLEDHPMKALDGLRASIKCKSLFELKQSKDLKTQPMVKTLAEISSLRELITKKAQRMAFAQLEDGTSSMEAVFFPEVYGQARKILSLQGEALCVSGTLKKDRGASLQIVAEGVQSLDSLLKKIKKIQLDLRPSSIDSDQLKSLKKLLLESDKGACSVKLVCKMDENSPLLSSIEIDSTGVLHDIEINHDFLQKLRKIFTNGQNIHLKI